MQRFLRGQLTTKVRIEDPSLDTFVNEKINTFTSSLEHATPFQSAKGKLALLFFEKKPKKTTWFTGSNDVCWEVVACICYETFKFLFFITLWILIR